MQAINRQRVDAEAEDPAQRFCNQIREAFAQGKVFVEDENGGNPLGASRWGWTLQTIHHSDGTRSDDWRPSPGASMLGWIDQDFLYLLPDASYRLAYENLQRAGVMLIPQTPLWKLLVDRGYLQRGEKRYTTRKRIGTERHYVLKLVRRCIETYLSSPSGDNGDSGDNEA